MDLKHMDLEDLKIDPEFEAAIPPLTEDEFDLLKQNILLEGRLLSPLIIWNGTIVDGHNRYRILLEHPEIDYETLDKDFTDRFAASAWICKNQLGRRNLTPEQRIYLIGKQYSAMKESRGGERSNSDKHGQGKLVFSLYAARWDSKYSISAPLLFLLPDPEAGKIFRSRRTAAYRFCHSIPL